MRNITRGLAATATAVVAVSGLAVGTTAAANAATTSGTVTGPGGHRIRVVTPDRIRSIDAGTTARIRYAARIR